MPSKSTLFISYRQADEAEFTERIRDWLLHKYGEEHVYMDSDFPRFSDLEQIIRERIEKSDAVVLIIGKEWVNLLKQKAQNEEFDYVLFEIETAFSLGKLVAPVLIKGASMPRKSELPSSLQRLVKYTAAQLDGGKNFRPQISEIIADLEAALEKRKADEILKLIESHLVEGKKLFKNKIYDGAIAEFNKAIQLNPNNFTAHFNRAIAYMGNKNFNNSLEDINEAIRLAPTDSNAYLIRACIYEVHQEYLNAIEDYEKYLELGGDREGWDKTTIEEIIATLKKRL